MAVDTRTGSFLTPLTNGATTKVTLPWKPAALIVWSSPVPAAADDTGIVSHGFLMGMAGQSSSISVINQTSIGSGGNESGDWHQGAHGGSIIYMVSSSNSLILNCTVVFDNDGFTITRASGSDSAGMIFNYLAITGCESSLPATGSNITYTNQPSEQSTAFRWRPHAIIIPWAAGSYQSGYGRYGISVMACAESTTRWAACGSRAYPTAPRYGSGIKSAVAAVNPYGVVPGTTQLDWWTGTLGDNNKLTMTPNSPPTPGEQLAYIPMALRYLHAEVVHGAVPVTADTQFDLTGPTPVSPKGALLFSVGSAESGSALESGARLCLAGVDSTGATRHLTSHGRVSGSAQTRSKVGSGSIVGAIINPTDASHSDIVHFSSFVTSGVRLRTHATTPPSLAYFMATLVVGDPDPSVTQFTESPGDPIAASDSVAGASYGKPPTDYPDTDIWEQPISASQLFNAANRTVGYVHGSAYVSPYIFGFSRDGIPSSTVHTCVRINRATPTAYDSLNIPAPSGGGAFLRDYSAAAVAGGKVYTVGRDPANDHPVVVEFDPTIPDFASSYTIRAEVNYSATPGGTGYGFVEVILADSQYIYFTYRTYLWRMSLSTWTVDSIRDYTPVGGSSSNAFHGGAIDNDGIYLAQAISSGAAFDAYLTHINKSTMVKVRDVLFPTITDDMTIAGDYVVGSPEKNSIWAIPWGQNGGLAAYRKTDGQVLALGSFDAAFDARVAAQGATPTSIALKSYGVWAQNGWLLDLKLGAGSDPNWRRLYVIRLDPGIMAAWSPAPMSGSGHPWQGFVPPAPGRAKLVRRSAYFASYPPGYGHPNEFVADENSNFYAFTWSSPAGFLVIPGILPVDYYENLVDLATLSDGTVDHWGWSETDGDTASLADGVDDELHPPPVIVETVRAKPNLEAPDLALQWDPQSLATDLSIEANDLARDGGLKTALLLSLFTDRRADASDHLPDGETDRRGWWGDGFPIVEGDRSGSRLWLLAREKQTQAPLVHAEEYAREALQWLLDDRVAERIDVTAEIPRPGMLGLLVTIHRPHIDPVEYRFTHTWAAQGGE